MKSAITFFLALLSFSSFSQLNLDSGLVACYALNGNAYEAINGLHGQSNSAVPGQNRFGANNACMAIGFSTIELSSSALLKPGMLSFSAWIKPGSGGTILVTEGYQGNAAYSVSYESSLIRVKKSNTVSLVVLDSSIPVGNSVWSHICVTIDYNFIKIYINGVMQGSLAANMNFSYSAGKNVYLGKGFAGAIDNVRFYNRALSASEITQLYTADPACITATAAPVASFSGSPVRCAGDTLRLTDLSSGHPDSWTWSITGGTSLNSLEPIPLLYSRPAETIPPAL